jgi:hypothetical protein
LVGSVILSGAKNPILDAETLRFVQESTSKPQGRGRVAANAGVLGGNGGGVEVDATGGTGSVRLSLRAIHASYDSESMIKAFSYPSCSNKNQNKREKEKQIQFPIKRFHFFGNNTSWGRVRVSLATLRVIPLVAGPATTRAVERSLILTSNLKAISKVAG